MHISDADWMSELNPDHLRRRPGYLRGSCKFHEVNSESARELQ